MYTNGKRKKTLKECKLILIFPSPSLAPGEVERDSRGLRISFVRIGLQNIFFIQKYAEVVVIIYIVCSLR